MALSIEALRTAASNYKTRLMEQPAPADVGAQGQIKVANQVVESLINGRERERSEFNTAEIVQLLTEIIASTGQYAPLCTTQPLSDSSIVEGAQKALPTAWLGAVSYQWLFDDNTGNFRPIEDGATFSGTDTDTLTINSMSAATVGRYYLRATNAGGNTSDSQVAILGMA